MVKEHMFVGRRRNCALILHGKEGRFDDPLKPNCGCGPITFQVIVRELFILYALLHMTINPRRGSKEKWIKEKQRIRVVPEAGRWWPSVIKKHVVFLV